MYPGGGAISGAASACYAAFFGQVGDFGCHDGTWIHGLQAPVFMRGEHLRGFAAALAQTCAHALAPALAPTPAPAPAIALAPAHAVA